MTKVYDEGRLTWFLHACGVMKWYKLCQRSKMQHQDVQDRYCVKYEVSSALKQITKVRNVPIIVIPRSLDLVHGGTTAEMR